jgi:SAM-dependent methyltransferase
MANPVSWYDANAETVVAQYEGVSSDDVHDWLRDLLPERPTTVLDVGAGSGRDAAWLASKGHDVVAVEPSASMQAAATSLHPNVRVRWIDDSLPALATVTRSGLSFDFILLSAVWMHLSMSDRPRAFRKLINLLKPGGLLAITLRQGPADQARGIYPVSLAEVEALARNHGAYLERQTKAEDKLGRRDVYWVQVAVRLPDDGTGALPLLRHVILNDDKSSTYKLALLRTLCRIADGAAGFARDENDDFVAVPLGLVALVWIRLFKPLLAAELPQRPSNIGLEGLGFVKDAYRKLGDVSHLDLRVGMTFSNERGISLHRALRDAANTIERMPATFMTFPNGGPIFRVKKIGRLPRPPRFQLDQAYLFSFGELLVPRNLWMAFQRLDVWIEPALVAEWTRLMKSYASRQGAPVEDATITTAMSWDDPARDVGLARERALEICNAGGLFCVWSGKRLHGKNIEIDHCFPWSVWPCGDLWNLMPAHKTVNRKKGARLPSESHLRNAQDRIINWWDAAYADNYPVLSGRFWLEAKSSLPSMNADDSALSDLFDAVCLQRMRFKHDQQVPEWITDQYV